MICKSCNREVNSVNNQGICFECFQSKEPSYNDFETIPKNKIIAEFVRSPAKTNSDMCITIPRWVKKNKPLDRAKHYKILIIDIE
jgi:hypothetical protein